MIFSLLLLLLDSSRGQRPHHQKTFSKAPETGSINISAGKEVKRKLEDCKITLKRYKHMIKM
jgi:hypothetical protein